MPRTRAALLDGAARAVEVSGTKITMAQVAAAGGVAKATLYNHFRTRDAVLAALLVAEVDAIVDAQAGKPIEAALADAAAAIADHPVRRGLARVEPAVLAALGRIDPAARRLGPRPGRGRRAARALRLRRRRHRPALAGLVPAFARQPGGHRGRRSRARRRPAAGRRPDPTPAARTGRADRLSREATPAE